MREFLEGRIVVTTGDITEMEVDAIVNAANSSLLGGGGVDGAIHRQGGPKILEECKQIRAHYYPQGLPTGKAVITTGGNLAAPKVIHTVGPVWHGGGRGEDEELTAAYENSLKLAAESGFDSIAFPAISTGVYGFPKSRAALIAYGSIKDFLQQHHKPRIVYLVFYSNQDAELFLESLRTQGVE
ncbi:MAG TPA: O-acetyl-ADP-ribose deacetylase [Sediminispirochaeta sp.]|nr:O-acetyl-ADP-ribose deacetylase [Sediminispirochaeta sp.]